MLLEMVLHTHACICTGARMCALAAPHVYMCVRVYEFMCMCVSLARASTHQHVCHPLVFNALHKTGFLALSTVLTTTTGIRARTRAHAHVYAHTHTSACMHVSVCTHVCGIIFVSVHTRV